MMSRMIAADASPTLMSPVRVDSRLIASLAAVYVFWSSTYLAIRIAVKELPPLLSMGGRFAVAGVVMLLIARRRGAAWPTARDWLRVLPIGAFLFLGGNGLTSIAQQSVPSGGAAVVAATMPLWIGILGFVTGERPTKREWSALVIGFVGILILAGGPSLGGEPIHVVMLIGSPIAWALGSILAKRLDRPFAKDAFMLPGMEMITGAAVVMVVGVARGEHVPADASAGAWLAVIYLLVFGSLLGFTAFNWLLRNARPVVATSYAYVNPPLAVLLGAALYGESLGLSTLAANGLILVAVYLVLSRVRR